MEQLLSNPEFLDKVTQGTSVCVVYVQTKAMQGMILEGILLLVCSALAFFAFTRAYKQWNDCSDGILCSLSISGGILTSFLSLAMLFDFIECYNAYANPVGYIIYTTLK